MFLAMRGNDLKKHQYQQAKNRARRAKMDQKIDTFGHIHTRVLAILWIEQVVIRAFSKLFRNCLGSV